MILLTLEGLPRSCVELLKSVQQITKTFIIPSPIAPTATSCHAPADEIVSVLYNILANMRVLQRAQQLADSSIVCGAHWIDTPTTTLDMKARLVLHDVCLELSEELKRAYDLVISKHIIVFLKVPVHDMFNIMLEKMETRDVLLDDLIRSEEHTSELQSLRHLVCRLLLEKKKRSAAHRLCVTSDSSGQARFVCGTELITRDER